MEGKGERERTRQKLLDWMMSQGYSKLKEEAQHRETWSQRAENLKKKTVNSNSKMIRVLTFRVLAEFESWGIKGIKGIV